MSAAASPADNPRLTEQPNHAGRSSPRARYPQPFGMRIGVVLERFLD
jgi:hypothetical protein